MGSCCFEAGSSSFTDHRTVLLALNTRQEVTEKATELHKVEKRIPKIQHSLDAADVSGFNQIPLIGSTLGRRQNSTQLLPTLRRMRESMKISAISTTLWRKRKR